MCACRGINLNAAGLRNPGVTPASSATMNTCSLAPLVCAYESNHGQEAHGVDQKLSHEHL